MWIQFQQLENEMETLNWLNAHLGNVAIGAQLFIIAIAVFGIVESKTFFRRVRHTGVLVLALITLFGLIKLSKGALTLF